MQPIKKVSCFGVLEFWSIGVLEKAKARISDRTNAYHYSITPADFRVKERP
jgi:hypothetical protein